MRQTYTEDYGQGTWKQRIEYKKIFVPISSAGEGIGTNILIDQQAEKIHW